MMQDHFCHNQDKISPTQTKELKVKTFIIRKELYLNTDSIVSDTDKHSIRFFFYSMHECLSTHDNQGVQNKSYVSVKPVNLKPFYIKPYVTHESEIGFAEAEMEKLRQMGILHRGSSEFLSPIMLIKKSHSVAKLNKPLEYRLVVDFKYLNLHLLDIKFDYPEIETCLAQNR